MNQMLGINDHTGQSIINAHKVTNGGPKEIIKLISGNMQAPKFLTQKYGVGAFQLPFIKMGIRRQVIYVNRLRTYCNCSSDLTSKGVQKLKTIYNIRINKPNFTFKRVYNLILLEDLFIVAYGNLKSKPGVKTPGVGRLTPDGFNINLIQNIIKKLNSEQFKFNPLRRATPKANGKLRPLSIPSFKDKLVQEVMRIILESIFSSSFIPYSHGFQKNKRCHTALKDVRVIFAGVKWLMKRDIERCFDSLDHHKLVSILENRISDKRFVNLI